jgi:hypothetical protein
MKNLLIVTYICKHRVHQLVEVPQGMNDVLDCVSGIKVAKAQANLQRITVELII